MKDECEIDPAPDAMAIFYMQELTRTTSGFSAAWSNAVLSPHFLIKVFVYIEGEKSVTVYQSNAKECLTPKAHMNSHTVLLIWT